MINVFDVPVIALFDTGASHSFISHAACKRLELTPQLAETTLEVSTPGGGRLAAKDIISNLELNIGAETFKADLYVISMIEFDIIIGMDWLTQVGATILCSERKISFQSVGKEKASFHGIRMGGRVPVISAMKAIKMMRNGECRAFLVSLTGEREAKKTIEEVPVVRDFKYVFPEELPGMPPNRQLEFTIDLEPGAAPVSKAPYRMAPPELQELKVQLQELLDLGFIQPSVSPWGAPVLLKNNTKSTCASYSKPCVMRDCLPNSVSVSFG
ncbi:uncharacterized protein LOC131007954 [Salvia miltiorrhiza]|uniref:uncharacterized protein LOC131007954 n=1 Tax=Salvia miltiorrhiza TaxID=226208 RepID=UPI0025ACAFE8|nr:uncharacterized protein LOC131007954 [Salvia miltiorrhiza]